MNLKWKKRDLFNFYKKEKNFTIKFKNLLKIKTQKFN